AAGPRRVLVEPDRRGDAGLVRVAAPATRRGGSRAARLGRARRVARRAPRSPFRGDASGRAGRALRDALLRTALVPPSLASRTGERGARADPRGRRRHPGSGLALRRRCQNRDGALLGGAAVVGAELLLEDLRQFT